MFKNYIKTTLRNITKNLSHTFINVSGLTLGITGAIMIYLVVSHMGSYDNYHQNGDRIYRVVTQSKESTGYSETPGVPVPLPEAVKNYFPEIEKVTFASYQTSGLVTIEDGNGKANYFPEESGVVYMDSVFYQIFDRKWITGDSKTALREANAVVLSERFAKKYFGSSDAIGKLLRLDNKYDLKVTGVMEDFPANTQFPFDLMMSYETVRQEKLESGWNSIWSDEQCYVLLMKGADVKSANAKFPDFIDKNYPKSERYANTSDNRFHWFQPLAEIHFDTRFGNFIQSTSSKNNLIALSVIGIFLLLTAAINFINLTTAVAVNRSREVGIRKVMGSSRIQLAYQFFGETFMITLFSMLISIGLSEFLLSQVLNPFLGFNLSLDFGNNPALIGFLVLLLFVVSFLSGFYPSVMISGFKPVQALKNTITSRNLGGFTLRKSLVGLQFFITQFLIICTIVILWQTRFLKTFDMGFAREAIVLVDLPVRDVNKAQAIKTDLENLSTIEKVSLSFTAPASGTTNGTGFSFVNESEHYGVQMKYIDEDHLDVYKIPLLAGKNIIPEDTAHHILVNETLVKHVGIKSNDEIIGREVNLNGRKVTVDGVVRDFHTVSLGQQIEPVILIYRRSRFELASFTIQLSEWENVRKYVEEKWKAQYPEYAIHLRFMEDDIANFYEDEQRISKMISGFCFVAILIGCLGLYGLVMFMSKMKTKEVGIRKTLGASVLSIVNMFSWEFVKLVLISFVIASPCAAWVMSKWLNNYSYRINLSWQVFLVGLLVTCLIAFVTIAHRSIKSALANPVDSLRVE